MFSMSATLLGAAVIFIHSLCSLNDMSHKTNYIRRVAYILMCVGAFGVIAREIFSGISGTWPQASLIAGAALYFAGKHRADIIGAILSLFMWRHVAPGVGKRFGHEH